ncbi:hypothetical protein ACFFJY_02615 [Fictibacillus aquaticus]|nr:hypothetical protein [Fictibacillus aquaticus]
MANFLTPEEIFRKKKRNKGLLYVALFLGVILLSSGATFLLGAL